MTSGFNIDMEKKRPKCTTPIPAGALGIVNANEVKTRKYINA
jgi:hypothetical protein